MEVGLCSSGTLRVFGKKEGYEALKNAGFTVIDNGEPWDAYAPFSGVYTLSGGAFEEHFYNEREMIDAAGLKCVQTHAPFPTYPDPRAGVDRAEEYRFMIDALKKSFRATQILGAKYEVVHCAMRCGWGEDDDPKKTLAMNLELFSELLPEARKAGVTIALENMPLGRIPSALPESLIEMIDRMNDEYFAACLDTGHANVTGVAPGKYVRLLGDRLKVLHVHDNDGKNDQHRAPFTGTIDWEDFTSALAETGFRGVMSLESMFDEKQPKEAVSRVLNGFYRDGVRLAEAVEQKRGR